MRGTFDVAKDGDLLNTSANVEALRKLWLDRTLIRGNDLGPGDPGDFDHGAWHVACHVCGGAGVRRLEDGRLAWLQISHDPARDEYFASVTARDGNRARVLRIDSAEGRQLLERSTLLGYVEGTSVGRTSARNVNDAPDLFNLWRRQDFDQPAGSNEDGGRVWEHWCTLRDLRVHNRIGTSVLTALVSLAASLDDAFIPSVARGRREYGHPVQLCAMVTAGLIGPHAATLDLVPEKIPSAAEALLRESTEADALAAAEAMPWRKSRQYFMFARKIEGWNDAASVRRDLEKARRE